MRKNYAEQMTIGEVGIKNIEFDIFSRHEMTPILMSLQHLYVNEREVVHEICHLIMQDINKEESIDLGCSGLNYWEILVLASVRLGCNLNFDALQDLADNHKNLRQMLMVGPYKNNRYPRSTIHDNLSKLSGDTLEEISQYVVRIGHKLVPKAIEKVRGDTFVVKKNIHYPTDTNLLFDGIRKMLKLSSKLADAFDILGWRQHAYHLQKFKTLRRKIEKAARSRAKDRDERLYNLYKEMIDEVNKLTERSVSTIHIFQKMEIGADEKTTRYWNGVISNLYYFIAGTEYVCDLAKRRMLEGEKIPHSEKVFSLFEPDTEMINRGKVPIPYEFGHRVMIVEDEAGFILQSKVMDIGMTDEKILVDMMKDLQARYENRICSASFDKGFWSPSNLKELCKIVKIACLPKKGRHAEADKLREGSTEFGDARKKHSGVESAIHALVSGNGLGRCRDKGVDGYRRYVALGVLGRNLHTLGRLLISKKREERGLKPLRLRS
ncbi:MAG: ISNCY family transposase [Desulfobacterales bacterium]|nr:ISNCY family transposase [Desulfobacterales bacterium]